jgi:hypothetical protein
VHLSIFLFFLDHIVFIFHWCSHSIFFNLERELQETSEYIENDELLQLASPALTTTEMTELLQFRHPKSLYMILHDPAGTGKSQVINVLKCFAKS